MRSGKWNFLYVTFAIAISGLAVTGCRKQNGIDNNNVIRTPYGLYFSNALGDLQNTNDGKTFKFKYSADGFAPRAITTSGNNVIWIKKDVFVSTNDDNYNVTAGGVPAQVKWQSMVLDVPDKNIVLLASPAGFGVQRSDNNGVIWSTDIVKPTSPSPTRINSFTQLSNGRVFGLENSTGALFEREFPQGWDTVIATTPLPSGSYYLAHINNTLIAADYTGGGGVYYSMDNGWNWAAYNGIPGNQEIRSIAGPLNQVVLAGTDSAGIYRLVGSTFQPSNNGLKPFTTVYGITGKQDTYKNEIIRQYVYIATSTGLYRSEDLGQNWVLVYSGDIRALY